MNIDQWQSTVRSASPHQHAVVVGAPGTGKSTLIASLLADEVAAGSNDSVAIAHSRTTASMLRTRLEQLSDRPISGTRVRTAASFAFALLRARASQQGGPQPQLATGPVIDEALRVAVATHTPSFTDSAESMLDSQRFRAEIRELWRVMDDHDLDDDTAAAVIRTVFGTSAAESEVTTVAGARVPSGDRWDLARLAIHDARATLARDGLLTSSGVVRAAREAIRTDAAALHEFLPKRVLIDEAAELNEGALGLFAALAEHGTILWAFGDPDSVTTAFQGEATRILSDFDGELRRKAPQLSPAQPNRIVLQGVHRGTPRLRSFAQSIAEGIGTHGGSEHRGANVVDDPESTVAQAHDPIEATVLTSESERLGALAFRLREAALGASGEAPVAWGEMAVICRSRRDVETVARELAEREVPTRVVGGGIALREHRVVRDLLLGLSYAYGTAQLWPEDIMRLATGPLGGLSSIDAKRFRAGVLVDARLRAAENGGEPDTLWELLQASLRGEHTQPLLDTPAARRVHRLIGGIRAAANTVTSGGTAREALWNLWEAAGIAETLQNQALGRSREIAASANRTLDAVLALFFVFEREESGSHTRPVTALIDEILTSDVPEDSLAKIGEGDAVVVSTPQAVRGSEFTLVCVHGLQEGVWPNMRPRGGLLPVGTLERALQHGVHHALRSGASVPQLPIIDARRTTLHDELRLLYAAVTRATRYVFAVSLRNEREYPSAFWTPFSGYDHETTIIPTAGLTVRGSVAALRRALEEQPDNYAAARDLAALAAAGVPGAHPDDWYGLRTDPASPPDSDQQVTLSPSALDSIEKCPLSWKLYRLMGEGVPQFPLAFGTILHRIFEDMCREPQGTRAHDLHEETVPPAPAEVHVRNRPVPEVLDEVESRWGLTLRSDGPSPGTGPSGGTDTSDGSMPESVRRIAQYRDEFLRMPVVAEWDRERALVNAISQVQAMRAFLNDQLRSGWIPALTETALDVTVGRVRLRGRADLILQRDDGRDSDDPVRVQVIDLKTGGIRDDLQDVSDNGQLSAYQTAVAYGALDPHFPDATGTVPAGASLLFTKQPRTRQTYEVRHQPEFTPAHVERFIERVVDLAERAYGAPTIAEVEDHCRDERHTTPCRLHIVPPVSHPRKDIA